MSAEQLDRELRFAVAPITHVDVRGPSSTHDNTWTFSGYAAVFNAETVLLDSKMIKLTESIRPEFFDRTLREQGLETPSGVVHYNLGHDMNRAVAATNVPGGQPGSLLLRADHNQGLHFLAKVSRDDPDGHTLAVRVRDGVIRQASFAFTIREAAYTYTENEEGPDIDHRELVDCGHLYDVCGTPQGAYSQTTTGLQQYAAALGAIWLPTWRDHKIGQPEEVDPRLLGNLPEGGQQRQPDMGGASDVSPKGSAAETPELEWPDLDALDPHGARRKPIQLDGS